MPHTEIYVKGDWSMYNIEGWQCVYRKCSNKIHTAVSYSHLRNPRLRTAILRASQSSESTTFQLAHLMKEEKTLRAWRSEDTAVSFPITQLLRQCWRSPCSLRKDQHFRNLTVKASHMAQCLTSDSKPPNEMWFLQRAHEIDVWGHGDDIQLMRPMEEMPFYQNRK